jgi:hypothetical protein
MLICIICIRAAPVCTDPGVFGAGDDENGVRFSEKGGFRMVATLAGEVTLAYSADFSCLLTSV